LIREETSLGFVQSAVDFGYFFAIPRRSLDFIVKVSGGEEDFECCLIAECDEKGNSSSTSG
jgi:hypothetical protein